MLRNDSLNLSSTAKILQLDEPVLRQVAKCLSKDEINSPEIQNLIELMKNTMRAAPGVGLAAPQIGHSLQLVVIEDRSDYIQQIPKYILEERGRRPVPYHVIINPKLTILGKEEKFFFEGCLSVNGKCRVTPRALKVKVDCLDEKGEEKVIHAEGWYARILQHEIDHLNGKLFIDIAPKETEISMSDYRNKWVNSFEEDAVNFMEKQRSIRKV